MGGELVIHPHLPWRGSTLFHSRGWETPRLLTPWAPLMQSGPGRALCPFTSVAHGVHSRRHRVIIECGRCKLTGFVGFVFQVITGALQCLIWVLRFPLPSIETKAEQLTKHLFLLLKDYAKLGAAKGQNFHLVVNCFKVSSFTST